MSEPSYADGDVVWVKWSNCWWPGEVWSASRVPDDISTSLKKPVIAFVKFLQEESFEFVYNHSNIMKYSCEKKLDFIKKGMDKFRKSTKIMSNFPGDVVKAEKLTGGDVNILDNMEFQQKQKSSVTSIQNLLTDTPTLDTVKPSTTYNSSNKVQTSKSFTPKSEKTISCKLCDFTTDRINLLMIHMRNHSATLTPRSNESFPVIEVKKTATVRYTSKKVTSSNDSIADDVRRIKESLEPKQTLPKKPRESLKTVTSRKPRVPQKKSVKKCLQEIVENPKPSNDVTKLLADWEDDEGEENAEAIKEKSPEMINASTLKVQTKESAKSSRSIRNIPKKSLNEVCVQPAEVDQTQVIVTNESSLACTLESSKSTDEAEDKKTTQILSKKAQKGNKRKSTITEIVISQPDADKLEENDRLITATEKLLDMTKVPKIGSPQQSSTFHESNDFDQINLPPKERSKRKFRDNINLKLPVKGNSENNGGAIKNSVQSEDKKISPSEVTLPYKKKHSSRIVTPEKPLQLIRETRSGRDVSNVAKHDSSESRMRKRKSSEVKQTEIIKSMSTNTDESLGSQEMLKQQSPLRDVNPVTLEPEAASPIIKTAVATSQHRGQKRRISIDEEKVTSTLNYYGDDSSERKKMHKAGSETPPRKIVACPSDTICITSKGQLAVTRTDSLVTTQANSVIVTSQVIISEATLPSSGTSNILCDSKPHVSSNLKTHATIKPALKFPAENLIEMKKQGLITTGLDKKNKLTEKGKQIYKEQIKEKTAEVAAIETSDRGKTVMDKELKSSLDQNTDVISSAKKTESAPETNAVTQIATKEAVGAQIEKVEETEPEMKEKASPKPVINESTNNNETQKELSASENLQEVPEETTTQEPVENGKDADAESEVQTEDPNNGGAGLIALSAESFGGPPNCFYLCRQVEPDRYEPVDNQILILNAQNALVPLEGEIIEDTITPQNSNIVITTPSGQKIELNHFTIMALQEQADENGMASVELGGESLDLNINGILEAISQQQEANESESLMTAAMLIEGDNALILDTTEIATEIHHSATQVSETLSKPIMSTTVAPEIGSTRSTISETVSKNLNIEDSLATIGVTTQTTRSNVPKSLELPITVTNPTIAETANHRKLANTPVVLGELTEVPTESYIIQATDNGSDA